jgi:hypothetical protein
LVEAGNAPSVISDLAVFDKTFGLPLCTTSNGCIRKVNQRGGYKPPGLNRGWASETSLDIDATRSICPDCHILIVEANSSSRHDLGVATREAVKLGATEVSNSYSFGEEEHESDRAYNYPGVVVTASTGDCGYLSSSSHNTDCLFSESDAAYPADAPTVIGVGGTSLQPEPGGGFGESLWSESGSGCSSVFPAPPWQLSAPGFAAAGCGTFRSEVDVASFADNELGLNVYDSTPDGSHDPTGWSRVGGTSLASPIIASEFALAGGSHGVAYPAATLYSHLGDVTALYDVTKGRNGKCKTTSCAAAPGFDGASGVGVPIGLKAFSNPGTPEVTAPPTAGVGTPGTSLVGTAGAWSSEATISYQWQQRRGGFFVDVPGAVEAAYAPPATTNCVALRLEVVAENAAGVASASSSPVTFVRAGTSCPLSP